MEKRTVFLCLILLHLMLGSWTAAKDLDAREGAGNRDNEAHTADNAHERLISTCIPKEVTVRDAYLALSPISARYETLALLLLIDRGLLGNIKMDCPGDNDCKYRETIRVWYYGRVDPSWDELVYALERMGEKQVARDVRINYLCLSESSTVSHDTLSERPLLNYSNTAETMKYLVTEFEEMVDSFEDHLVENPPDLEIFKHRLLHILHPPTAMNINGEHIGLKGFIDDVINEAESVTKIIAFFHTHIMCNFFEYEILHPLFAKFGNKELQERLENYKCHVYVFQYVTNLSKFFQFWSNSAEPPEGFVAYTLKLMASPTDLNNATLVDVRGIKKKLAKRYSLPPYAFRFASGSIEGEYDISLTWFIRSVVVQEVVQTESNDSDFLYYKDVIYIEVGNHVVFDQCFEIRKRQLYSLVSLFFTILLIVMCLMQLTIRNPFVIEIIDFFGPSTQICLGIGSNSIIAFILFTIWMTIMHTKSVGLRYYTTTGAVVGIIIGMLMGIAARLSLISERGTVILSTMVLGLTVGVLAEITAEMSGAMVGAITGAVLCGYLRRVCTKITVKFTVKGSLVDVTKGIIIVGAVFGALAEVLISGTGAVIQPIVALIIRLEVTSSLADTFNVAEFLIAVAMVIGLIIGGNAALETVKLMEQAVRRRKFAYVLVAFSLTFSMVVALVAGASILQLLALFPEISCIYYLILETITSYCKKRA